MTWDCYTNTEPVARKEYRCDAADCIHRVICFEDLEGDEIPVYQKAKAEGFKILKGTKYLKTSGFWEGEPSVFRARPDLDEICLKYSLYDE